MSTLEECMQFSTDFKVTESTTDEGQMKLTANFTVDLHTCGGPTDDERQGCLPCNDSTAPYSEPRELRLIVTDPSQSEIAKASLYDACMKSMKRTQ